jgi:hypothetical protein
MEAKMKTNKRISDTKEMPETTKFYYWLKEKDQMSVVQRFLVLF